MSHVAILAVRALDEAARRGELAPLRGVQVIGLGDLTLVEAVQIHEVEEEQRLLERAGTVEEEVLLGMEQTALDARDVGDEIDWERIAIHMDVREDGLAERMIAILERAKILDHREPAVRRNLEASRLVREREVVVAPVVPPVVQYARTPGRYGVDVATREGGVLSQETVKVLDLLGRDRRVLRDGRHVRVHVERESQEVQRLLRLDVRTHVVGDADHVLPPAVVVNIVANVLEPSVSFVLLEARVREPVGFGVVGRPDMNVVEPSFAPVAT